jgi:pimeloyl-ACP methyl ester carboxylesterase
MQYQSEDLSLYYERYGVGRPLVSLHGFGPDHHLMTGCMEPLFRERRGWQRLYPDLPGMGKTPGPDWLTRSDQILDAVLAFIDDLLPARRFALVGESYGGYLARGIVHRRPEQVDGLLLICPVVIAERAPRTLPPHVTLVKDETFLAQLDPDQRAGFDTFAVVQTSRTWQRTRREVQVGFEVADRTFLSRLQEQGGYALSFDPDAGPPFEKPTLILAARQDATVGYRDAWPLLANYPRATFAVLDRAGHNLQIEQEDVFNALVSEWLDRVEAV